MSCPLFSAAAALLGAEIAASAPHLRLRDVALHSTTDASPHGIASLASAALPAAPDLSLHITFNAEDGPVIWGDGSAAWLCSEDEIPEDSSSEEEWTTRGVNRKAAPKGSDRLAPALAARLRITDGGVLDDLIRSLAPPPPAAAGERRC